MNIMLHIPFTQCHTTVLGKQIKIMTEAERREASEPYLEMLRQWRGGPEEAFADPLQAAELAEISARYRRRLAEAALGLTA